ncbi:Peroxisome size and maintenance regulator [Emydomyces testavorans]|uniref:Peroxisome size and maintenance regulator n=1 Tax=Emydomyces testavorans TaxID=2070801 RepID=A0AAF0DH02_9EURO|nr:Peroxisome size and maintenance regulator [Emydomyces testavorans]
MDEYTAETSVNQEEDELVPTNSKSDEHREGPSQSRLSATYVREKLHDWRSSWHDEAAASPATSIQDRLVSRLLQQVIPVEDADDEEPSVAKRPERPAFSLPTMTSNFRRFNASWRKPTQTWSFLFVYSFICLDPYLLLIAPFILLLFFIMIPAFLARHPPPPPSASTSSTTPYYSYEGPALAPATTIKPVPETSKDFFHNMRDLQNSMADFATLHDAAVAVISPATNFSDETFSSVLFLLFTVLGVSLFLTAHLLPWRFIFLIGGNGAILSSHPRAEIVFKIFQLYDNEMKEAPQKEKESDLDKRVVIFGISVPKTLSGLLAFLKSIVAISLDSYSEEREVEIFELQHRTLSPFSGMSGWEPFLFTPTPYDPLSPSRIAGDRPKGTRFFEDVRPPRGWAWKGKKWELDLDCREWVMERMVTGVEFEVPSSNGEGIGEEVGGWVWDLPFQPQGEGLRDKTDEPPCGSSRNANFDASSKRKNGVGGGGAISKIEWEEATRHAERTGEWRRRRWVRIVQRITVDEKAPV